MHKNSSISSLFPSNDTDTYSNLLKNYVSMYYSLRFCLNKFIVIVIHYMCNV